MCLWLNPAQAGISPLRSHKSNLSARQLQSPRTHSSWVSVMFRYHCQHNRITSSLQVSNQHFKCSAHSPMKNTCSAHVVLSQSTKQYRLRLKFSKFLTCNLIHFPASSLLFPNFLFRTLQSDGLYLFCLFSMRDSISYSHKIQDLNYGLHIYSPCLKKENGRQDSVSDSSN